MKNLIRNGFCQAKVERVVELDKRGEDNRQKETEVKDFKDIQAEVEAIMKPESDKKLSLADELAQMKKEMAILQAGNVKTEDNNEVKDKTPDVNEELEAAKEEYKALFGKYPHHMAQLKGINKKIAEKKA